MATFQICPIFWPKSSDITVLYSYISISVPLFTMLYVSSVLGTGKGGKSIWNRKFEDEFHENLKVSTLTVAALSTDALIWQTGSTVVCSYYRSSE